MFSLGRILLLTFDGSFFLTERRRFSLDGVLRTPFLFSLWIVFSLSAVVGSSDLLGFYEFHRVCWDLVTTYFCEVPRWRFVSQAALFVIWSSCLWAVCSMPTLICILGGSLKLQGMRDSGASCLNGAYAWKSCMPQVPRAHQGVSKRRLHEYV